MDNRNITNSFSIKTSGTMFLFLCIILLGPPTVYGTTQSSKTFDSGQPSPEWIIGKKMPTPRTEIMGDVIDKKIYTAGGVDYHKGGQVDRVEVYDTKIAWRNMIHQLTNGHIKPRCPLSEWERKQ